MKREISIKKYNDLCDKIRSLVLYSEAFKKKNGKREKEIRNLHEMIHEDAIELVNRVKSLEEFLANLSEEENEDDS